MTAPMEASAEMKVQPQQAPPSPGPTRVGRRPTTRCVWPTDYRNTCRHPASFGHTCRDHMTLVRRNVGTLNCAWPGCIRRAWDRKGLCSFHWKVAFDLIDR